jgi:hypothetical protein
MFSKLFPIQNLEFTLDLSEKKLQVRIRFFTITFAFFWKIQKHVFTYFCVQQESEGNLMEDIKLTISSQKTSRGEFQNSNLEPSSQKKNRKQKFILKNSHEFKNYYHVYTPTSTPIENSTEFSPEILSKIKLTDFPGLTGSFSIEISRQLWIKLTMVLKYFLGSTFLTVI